MLHSVSETTELQETKEPDHLPSNTLQTEPSQREVVLLSLISYLIFLSFLSLFRGYFARVDDFGDSTAYINVATAIRHWNFQGLVIKQFWGLSYAMAALSTLTGISDRAALLIVSFTASIAAVILAYRLWGGWIAGFFAILNFDWMQRSLLGGSEPLFVALLFGALLAARKDRWLLAAFLASTATLVRPLGIFALLGVGLILLSKRRFKDFAFATAIGLTLATLYMFPLARYFGDPLATVNSYRNPRWETLFGFPGYAIIKGTILYPAPWTNLVLTFGWIFLVLLACANMMVSKKFREYASRNPVEILFAAPYLCSLFTYNYSYWARGSFARFAIPVVPFVLLSLYRWVPKDRRVLWGVGAVCSILASASAVGVKHVIQVLR
jgi:hypothetical protein